MAEKNKIRLVRVHSSLGADALLFRSLSGSDELGRLFRYNLQVLSKDPDIAFADLLGQDLTLEMLVEDGSTRYFHGYVAEFSRDDDVGKFAAYSTVIVPWLWFLTRTADCRIFQNLSIPDIVAKIFEDNGFTDFELSLSGSYAQWDYCVQYRETAFNFISRLLEQEGIYYYFKHQDGKHTLVLADSLGAHDSIPGYAEIPLRRPDAQGITHEDCVLSWYPRHVIQPGAYVLADFNFLKPRSALSAAESIVRDHSRADLEVFDYPGEYDEQADGNRYAKTRLEELQCRHARASAEANARGICSGGLFKLVGEAAQAQSIEYLVISAAYQVSDGSFESGSSAGGVQFRVTFEAIDSNEQFRPDRVTPKPVVQGPQTAMVVGKQGEEIWTDENGRVKVQFHWDRQGKSNEDSSCWIRVAQIWAGKGWGGVLLPRIGQEVIVDFLEGDPDQPIITGRVYNGDSKPPYPLPDKKTVSALKSDSSPGGGGCNELRFEDKKGEEQVFIHGQKDLEIAIENDSLEAIGNNSELGIKGTYKVSVAKDVTEAFDANHKLDVAKDQTVKATNVTIEGLSSITLKVGGSSIKIDASGIVIKAPQVEVNGSAMVKVQGGMVKIN